MPTWAYGIFIVTGVWMIFSTTVLHPRRVPEKLRWPWLAVGALSLGMGIAGLAAVTG